MTLQSNIISVDCNRSGRELTAYLKGHLDAATSSAVETAVLHHHRADDEKTWIDLGNVTFCDSSGISLLFRLQQAIEADGTHFILCQPQAQVRRLLDMVDPLGLLKVRTR